MELEALKKVLASLDINPDEIKDEIYAKVPSNFQIFSKFFDSLQIFWFYQVFENLPETTFTRKLKFRSLEKSASLISWSGASCKPDYYCP